MTVLVKVVIAEFRSGDGEITKIGFINPNHQVWPRGSQLSTEFFNFILKVLKMENQEIHINSIIGSDYITVINEVITTKTMMIPIKSITAVEIKPIGTIAYFYNVLSLLLMLYVIVFLIVAFALNDIEIVKTSTKILTGLTLFMSFGPFFIYYNTSKIVFTSNGKQYKTKDYYKSNDIFKLKYSISKKMNNVTI